MSDGDLAFALQLQIAEQGAMPLSRFMAQCVGHYYAGCDPFGRQGDFITAPEISQMFGEMLGLWASLVWRRMGAPERVWLAELGPGRGTLMVDLLRAAGVDPDFTAALRPCLVETSPSLRLQQQRCLADSGAVWLLSIDDLPAGPAIILANEFFDALPIDQYVCRAAGWHERRVDWQEGRFCFVDGPRVDRSCMLAWGAPESAPGAIFEVGQAGLALAEQLGRRFAHSQGVLLVIDYGPAEPGAGDTLQALGKHNYVPPLQQPGQVDLTAHVDFTALARAAGPAFVSPIVSQGRFLRRLGILLRAELLAAARPDRAVSLWQGCRRLIDPDGMGTLFKALALSSADLADLPGLVP
jgi:NADH dehydrogenase [ubiquinone] 1 alpha subcomplex assembly factor 7